MEKQKAKAKQISERSQKTLDLMVEKIKQERQEKAKAFGEKEKAKEQKVRKEALKQGRPPLKLKPQASDTTDKNDNSETTTHTSQPTQQNGMRSLMRQSTKVRTPKTNLKKRA